MRIAVATQEDPFYIPPALHQLGEIRGRDIVGLIVLPAFNEGLTRTVRRLVRFYGPLDFLRLACRYGRAEILDLLNRVGPVARPYSAADVARRHRIPLYRPENINSAEFRKVLRTEVRPDLLVSLAASQVFGRDLLAIPPLGSINLHSGSLPRYQGMMPNFWTLANGEPEATVTVHYMAESLDAGDIILERPVPIDPGDSLHNLIVRSKEAGVRALAEAVEQVEQGRAHRQPMDVEHATYFSFPTRADARRLRAQGHGLL